MMTSISKKPVPAVSVVIPTFNRGNLVISSIESALSQTYRDCEIIVIDDGSTDDTCEKLKPYMGRIRYYYQENRGASAAQNMGVQLAKGEWVSILASDDTWLPTKLESQLRAIQVMGQEFGACFTDCSYVGNPCRKATTFQEAGFRPSTEIGSLEEPKRWILARHPILWVQSLLVKRLLMLESDGFDTQLSVAEDTDLLFRLSYKTRFCFVNQTLVNIDIGPDRTDRLSKLFAVGDERAFISQEILFKKWLQLLDGTPDLALRKLIADSLMQTYYAWARENMKRAQWSKFFKTIGKLRQCEIDYTNVLGMIFSRGISKLKSSCRPLQKQR